MWDWKGEGAGGTEKTVKGQEMDGGESKYIESPPAAESSVTKGAAQGPGCFSWRSWAPRAMPLGIQGPGSESSGSNETVGTSSDSGSHKPAMEVSIV